MVIVVKLMLLLFLNVNVNEQTNIQATLTDTTINIEIITIEFLPVIYFLFTITSMHTCNILIITPAPCIILSTRIVRRDGSGIIGRRIMVPSPPYKTNIIKASTITISRHVTITINVTLIIVISINITI